MSLAASFRMPGAGAPKVASWGAPVGSIKSTNSPGRHVSTRRASPSRVEHLIGNAVDTSAGGLAARMVHGPRAQSGFAPPRRLLRSPPTPRRGPAQLLRLGITALDPT